MKDATFAFFLANRQSDAALWNRSSDLMCQNCHPVLGNSQDTANILARYPNEHIEKPIPISPHTENQRIDTVESCASCHSEHIDFDHQPAEVTDAKCTDCHYNLNDFFIDDRGTENKITHFNEDHPSFDALKSDRGTLKFNHELHTSVGLMNAGDQMKLIKTLDSYPDSSGQLDEHVNVDGAIKLECRFCHQPTDESGFGPSTTVATSQLRFARSGKFMSMPAYKQHCQVCHPNELVLYKDLNVVQPLKIEHGGSPTKISDALQKYFDKVALASTQGNEKNSKNPAFDSRLQVPTRRKSTNDQKMNDTNDIHLHIAKASNAIRAGCLKCHIVSERDPGQGVPEILTMLSQNESESVENVFEFSWFKRGSFDHASHTHVDCVDCHEMSSGKSGLIRQGKNIGDDRPMIKNIESCRICHNEADKVIPLARPGPTNCTSCHTYHGGANRH